MPCTMYNNIFFITATTNAEQLLAEDSLTGKFLWVQNNTAYDCNLLIFPDVQGTKKPLQIALRSGGSIGIEAPLGSFQVWASKLNVAAVPVLPAGYGGIYKGISAVPAGLLPTGYLQVTSYDQVVSIQGTEGNSQAITYDNKPISYYTQDNNWQTEIYEYEGTINNAGITLAGIRHSFEQPEFIEVSIQCKGQVSMSLDMHPPAGGTNYLSNASGKYLYFGAGNSVKRLHPEFYLLTPNPWNNYPRGVPKGYQMTILTPEFGAGSADEPKVQILMKTMILVP